MMKFPKRLFRRDRKSVMLSAGKESTALTSINELFDEFGKDLEENRELDPSLRHGINLVNSGKRTEAATVFQDAAKVDPDYDIPYFWLAELRKQEEGPSAAVVALKDAAKKCRRKNVLLGYAAEVCLLECGEVREAIHLFAQCIAAMKTKPRRDEVGQQRAFLFMKELFLAFGDSVGAHWADNMQDVTHLDSSMVTKIRRASEVKSTERVVISHELPKIRDYLRSLRWK